MSFENAEGFPEQGAETRLTPPEPLVDIPRPEPPLRGRPLLPGVELAGDCVASPSTAFGTEYSEEAVVFPELADQHEEPAPEGPADDKPVHEEPTEPPEETRDTDGGAGGNNGSEGPPDALGEPGDGDDEGDKKREGEEGEEDSGQVEDAAIKVTETPMELPEGSPETEGRRVQKAINDMVDAWMPADEDADPSTIGVRDSMKQAAEQLFEERGYRTSDEDTTAETPTDAPSADRQPPSMRDIVTRSGKNLADAFYASNEALKRELGNLSEEDQRTVAFNNAQGLYLGYQEALRAYGPDSERTKYALRLYEGAQDMLDFHMEEAVDAEYGSVAPDPADIDTERTKTYSKSM